MAGILASATAIRTPVAESCPERVVLKYKESPSSSTLAPKILVLGCLLLGLAITAFSLLGGSGDAVLEDNPTTLPTANDPIDVAAEVAVASGDGFGLLDATGTVWLLRPGAESDDRLTRQYNGEVESRSPITSLVSR